MRRIKHDIEECVKRLELKPGDKIVMRFKERLTMDARQRIKEEMVMLFPGIITLVLSEDAEIEVIGPES